MNISHVHLYGSRAELLLILVRATRVSKKAVGQIEVLKYIHTVTRMSVTTDGVSIGHWIYLTLTDT
jgi:hypothetical protein